jgi:hypothetical protein
LCAHLIRYDAKSGGKYRITRVGATLSRLEATAEAVQFHRSFDPVAIEAACKARGMSLENPKQHASGKNAW